MICGLGKVLLRGVGPDSTVATFSAGVSIPEFTYVAFQGAFAAISCALVVGAIAERARFAAVLLFTALWLTLAYLPLAHRVWAGNGFLFTRGALDFAGGTVVHINAGVAGLVGAYMLGPRIGYRGERLSPHSLPLTFTVAALLWFGFNAGSALEVNGIAALAFLNTMLAASAAVLSWSAIESRLRGRASMLGAASGAVAGLVAITPACGTVGVVGALLTGVFTAPALGGTGAAGYDMSRQLAIQSLGVTITIAWSGVVAVLGLLVVGRVCSLRVDQDAEREGLDISAHGESAYGL